MESSSMPRNYYFLLGAFFISSVGNWFYQLALPLLVYEITGSALGMAVTYGLTYLPYVLFLPIGGVLADRIDRRRLLIIGDFVSAAVVGLLALLLWFDIHTMWLIYPTVFILAGVTPFYHPAFQSLVPSIVQDQQLAKGNAWLHSSENVISLAGPLLSGIFIASLGTITVLFIDAASFFISAILVIAIRIQSSGHVTSTAKASSWFQDLREGFQYVWAHPVLRYGSLLFLGTNFAITVFQANYIYFLTDVLHVTPDKIGIAFAIAGLGAIGGALISPKLGKHFQPGSLILGNTVIAGVLTLFLLIARDVFSVAVPWAIATALGTVNAVTWFTLRQRIVPAHLLGRVVALTRLIAFAAIPVAAVVGGVLLNATGNMYYIITIAAIVRVAAGCLGFLTPLHHDAPAKAPPLSVDRQEAVSVDQ